MRCTLCQTLQQRFSVGDNVAPRGYLAKFGDIFSCHKGIEGRGWGGEGRECWHLLGRDEGCYSTSCNVQDSPHNKELPAQTSPAPGWEVLSWTGFYYQGSFQLQNCWCYQVTRTYQDALDVDNETSCLKQRLGKDAFLLNQQRGFDQNVH